MIGIPGLSWSLKLILFWLVSSLFDTTFHQFPEQHLGRVWLRSKEKCSVWIDRQKITWWSCAVMCGHVLLRKQSCVILKRCAINFPQPDSKDKVQSHNRNNIERYRTSQKSKCRYSFVDKLYRKILSWSDSLSGSWFYLIHPNLL